MKTRNSQKSKFFCYCCDSKITQVNKSTEHIILNACGGRLKSDKLLCKNCNSLFGTRFDSHLAKTTNALANLLMINRDKGKSQPIKTKNSITNEPYYLALGGKPIPVKPKINLYEKDGEKMLNIQTHNTKVLKKVLKGLQRTYPNLDINSALKVAESKKYVDDSSYDIDGTIGGTEAFKSIAKSVINFYILKKGDPKFIKSLIPYLLGDEERDIVWMHYPNLSIYEPEINEVSHILKVVGCSKERILYGYLELFNTHCFIVRLCSDYIGIDFDADYVYDVLLEKQLNKKSKLILSASELNEIFLNKNNKPFENVKKRYARVINIAYRVQEKHQMGIILEETIEEVLGTIPKNASIDTKTMESLKIKLAESIALFFENRQRRRRS